MDKDERDHSDNQAMVSVGRCFGTPVHPVRSDYGPGVREDMVQLFQISMMEWHLSMIHAHRDTEGRMEKVGDLEFQGHTLTARCWCALFWIPWPKEHECRHQEHLSTIHTHRDIEGHMETSVTLSFKVTYWHHDVGVHFFEFLDPKNMNVDTKNIFLWFIFSDILKVTWKRSVTLGFKVTGQSRLSYTHIKLIFMIFGLFRFQQGVIYACKDFFKVLAISSWLWQGLFLYWSIPNHSLRRSSTSIRVAT